MKLELGLGLELRDHVNEAVENNKEYIINELSKYEDINELYNYENSVLYLLCIMYDLDNITNMFM